MPYASSIQIVNDANGTATAFLEDDGFLWQCQWNADAQRWDRGQVVPMAYGGEKLQALLVEDLFPTSGSPGDQAGNMPGIVLAYRVGKGSEAQIYASFGQWGSDGQLQWSAPLALTDSAVAKEDFDLLTSGEGRFDLVVQQREPQADLTTMIDALNGTPTGDLQRRLEEALSGARSDSDLSVSSFRINSAEAGQSGSESVQYELQINLQPTTKTGDWQSTGSLSAAQAIQPAPQPPLALGGNTQLDRAQLAQSGTAPSSVSTGVPNAATEATAPGSSGSNWTWLQRGGSTSGKQFTAQGVPVGDTIRTWSITPDWGKGIRAPEVAAAPAIDQAQAPTGEEDPIEIRPLFESLFEASQQSLASNALAGAAQDQTIASIGNNAQDAANVNEADIVNEGILVPDLISRREKKFALLGQFGTATTSTGWTAFSQSKIGGIVDSKKEVASAERDLENPGMIALERARSHILGGTFSTYYNLSNFGANPILNSIDYKFSAGYGFTGNTLRLSPEGDLWSWSATGQGGYSSDLSIDFADSPALAQSPLLVGAALLPWLASEGSALGSAIYAGAKRKGPIDPENSDGSFRIAPAKYEDNINVGLGITGLITSIVPPNWFWISNFSQPIPGMQKAKGGLANANFELKWLKNGVVGFYASGSAQLSGFSKDVGFKEWAGLSAGVALPLGAQVPLIKLYQQYPPVSEQANPGTTSASRREASVTAQDGAAYPFSYAPASGSQLFGTPATGGNTALNAGAIPLIGSSSALQSFGLVNSTAAANPTISLAQAGSGLKDGTYSNVPILALSLPGSTAATLSFTVSAGTIVENSVAITVPAGGGTYLDLPETQANSGLYVLIPDVFSTGILPDPGSAASGSELNLLQRLPLITLDSSQPGAPLTITPISAVLPAIPLAGASDPSSGSYPERDPATGLWAVPATGDNTAYTYVGVQVGLSPSSGGPTPAPLNSDVSASVRLSAGRILDVVLDQPLYLDQVDNGPYTLNLKIQQYLAANGFGGSLSDPTYAVSSESLALNNLVEDEAFTANPATSSSSTAAAVWLSAGVNDQLAAFPQLAGWPVQNRVAVSDDSGAIAYLNATDADGKPTYVTSGNDSLAQLSANPVSFSAASTPTAVTMAGAPGQKFSGASLVFWVEASGPVIPEVSSDGTENHQAFMEALYGAQRINYRINSLSSSGTQTGWETPNLADLYTPDDAVIRHLQAFEVMAGGQSQTLLVWDETPITGIKDLPSISLSGWIDGTSLIVRSLSGPPLQVGDLIGGSGVAEGTVITAILSAFDGSSGSYVVSRSQTMGSAASPLALNATDLRPATILKAGFINPNAADIQWNSLFTDAQGHSTIQTIPWDASKTPGLGIENLSAATQLQRADDGSIVETPVLSWNQGVRAPYREAMLNSQPFIYLDLGALAPGLNSINLGGASPDTTRTFASSSGLNFAIHGALPKATASAVQNIDGTGVLATGTGSLYGPLGGLINNATPEQLAALGSAQLQGSLSGSTLTVTSLSGSLSVGELLSGAGLLPGTVITAVGSVDADGLGTYTVNQAQELASTSLLALPVAGALPYASFSGSLNGTSLTVSQLSGSLQVGDRVVGEGILATTTITAIGVVDASGNGTYTVNKAQIAGSSAPLALVATPAGSAPYTVEFWTQLSGGSNPSGAGLVAFGQPSAEAVGAAIAPSGWLLVNSFLVEPISYGQALQRGWISDAGGNALSALYGWGWAVVADGANTTAMGGNGGSNVYSNALKLTNLISGQSLKGVSTFLANYGLTPADLGSGIDGILADTIAAAPVTQLQFNNALDPDTGLPVSNLNGIAIDTSSALLNQGVLPAGDLESSAKQQQLTEMFEQLWAYQQQTGAAKVNFSLAPDSSASTTTPNALVSEQYVGYELGFSLFNGVAVSVDGEGRLVFDVAPGVSLTSTGAGTVPSDLRDGDWHYVVASFLPDQRSFTIGGNKVQLPSNVGTASLVIDNQLVASASGVINPFALLNLNDNALLLAGNAGGAIDQVAFYDQALTLATLPSGGDGSWPQLSAGDARQLLQELGFSSSQSDAAGTEAGAITDHWLARTVNPDDALLATSIAGFLPSAGNPLQGSWTTATPLNAVLASEATPGSASAGSLQNDLVIAIKPGDWGGNNWFNGSSTQSDPFNPAGKQLKTITVELTPTDATTPTVTRTLGPEQVLMANNTLDALQPRASTSDLAYTLLTATPALNLLIARKDDDPVDPTNSGDLDPQKTYSASVTLTFADGTTVTNDPAALTLSLNSAGSSLITDDRTNASGNSTLSNSSKTLATAEVIEAAPLQLKYIDSGVVLNSASSTAAANSPSTPSPARSFGQSQVIGSYTPTGSDFTNGWIAIAQPFSTNAISNPAGRVWIQYTGQSKGNTPSADASQAPSTWLNALARSNFSPEAPNLPLLNDAYNPSAYGGLLIQADATAGWGQNFGDTMLVADVDNDGTPDLVISAPQANGGGRVVIIDGDWIQANLTGSSGQTVLNLASPDSLGPHVTILTGGAASGDDATATDSANFGAALAFDSTSTTLWIGTPNYRQTAPDGSEVPVGAVYHYTSTPSDGIWGTGVATALPSPALGILGSTTSPDPTGASLTEYWGAQLGSAIAVANDGSGRIAVSAPGVQASLLYSGTEAVQEAANGKRNPSDPYGQGALVKIQLPQSTSVNVSGTTQVVWAVSSTAGTNNSQLQDVVRQNISPRSNQAAEESTSLQNLKALQSDHIADATPYNNQAIQTAAVGAVYLFNNAEDLSRLSGSGGVNAGSVATSANKGASFYGAQPWNTLQKSGFGSSLAFANLSKLPNGDSLVIGASTTGGPGSVYALDPQWSFSAPSDAQPWLLNTSFDNNQYLAHLASSLTLYGAASGDQFGSGLLNLGDTNGDTFDDLLIQAFNAASGAGNGYVLFGADQLVSTTSSSGSFQPSQTATGSVAAGSIGTFKRADGSSFSSTILSELGTGTGATSQGTFGPGDVNGDGLKDIPLGAGGNGQAYLTYGQNYLKAISNLQLQKLASNTGYLLDGLATATQGSLRSIGDFNGDGYGDFVSILPGPLTDTVRIELGANTQEILADYPYNFYNFQVAPGTQVLPGGDINGDGYADVVLFLQQNLLSSAAEGNAGDGSTTGILYGRSSAQLPLGSGFGLLAPVNPTSNPLAPLPTGQIGGALSTRAPAMLALGSTIYAVWCDETGNGDLWFAQSGDGGNSWSADTNLSATIPTLASASTPSLASYNDTLFLAFSNGSGQLTLSSWDPASGTPSLWSTPTVLSSDGSSSFTSALSPQLISSGDGLAISWVSADGTLARTISTSPGTTIWTAVDGADGGGSSPFNPAVAIDASGTVYMARVGLNNQLYWTSSSNGGQSWASWQELPSGMTSQDAPSLAVVNGRLHLTYLGAGNQELNISQLVDASSNSWTPQTVISNQTAGTGLGAVAIGETVGTTEGLAIYYVADNSTGTILRTWSATPLSASSWSGSQRLGVTSSNANGFTTSSPLAVTRFQGNTVLAYMGDTSTTNTTAYVATAGNTPSTSGNWTTIATHDTGNRLGIGLSSDTTGVLLNTSDTSTGQQAIHRLTPPSGNGSWSQSVDTSRTTVSSGASTASLLAVPPIGSGAAELLLAVVDSSSGDRVVTSNRALVNNWLQQQQLLERIETTDGTVSFQPIDATAAPSATLLNGAPVLAVNNNGTLTLHASDDGKTFRLAASFSPGSANQAGSTAAGLTTTDTGLALTYLTSDGSVSLQRLNLLQLDGTPVEGVVINADGSIDTSAANLQWQGINLGSGSGWSTAVGTVPLSVNGTLLLGSTSNASGSPNTVQLNAIPVLSNPDSTTWLNSTVQLPDSRAGWTLQQQAGGSSLSAVGDITGDGNADLLVTAAAVQSGGTSFTGLRLISGAATSSQILAANDATAGSQNVQVAASFGGNRTIPWATLSGDPNGATSLTLTATDTTYGHPYVISTTLNLPAFSATAGDSSSLKTLFNPRLKPSAEVVGLGLGFGDLSLNTSSRFGDLNADGRLDGLQGSPTTVYGADGLGWHVWSLRAAGDVNANGTDDVMLSLVSPEAVLNVNGVLAPQWIQPVLLDGALFKVDINTNSFQLNDLRAPLNPGAYKQLQDQNTTSDTQPWPLLQNWLQPILPFAAPQTADSIGYTEAPASGWVSTRIEVYNEDVHAITANSSDGDLVMFTQVLDSSSGDWSPGDITFYNPATGRRQTSMSMPSIFEGCFLGQAAYYQGSLYIAAKGANNGLRLYHISEQDLQANPASGWSYQDIKDTNGATISSSLAPALVNEGDRLGLYFASNTSRGTLTYYFLKGAYSSTASWVPGGNNGGEISSNLGNPINLFNLNGVNSRPSTLMVSAAVSDGVTYVGYASNAADQNDPRACVIRKPVNPGDGSGIWEGYTTVALPAGNNDLALSANQSQVSLVLDDGYEADNSGNGFQIYTYSAYPSAPGDNAYMGPQGSAAYSDRFIGVGSLGSQIALLARDNTDYINLKLIGTPWNSEAGQQSLAGYSVDGNIDVNGDGFMDMLASDPSDPSLNVDNQYVLFGGDYLNIASQVGTPGDDVINGTPLADVIYSIQGADQVTSNGGSDVIITGAGDDTISIQDNGFIRIDAGSGFDQLQLQGLANQRYDFRLNVPNPEYFAGTKLRDIELISSIDYGANSLSFDAAEINAINPDRVLFVTPDARDSLTLSTEFNRNAAFDTSFGGQLWSAYAAAPASATPASDNPALIYVAIPTGQSSGWLGTNVIIADTPPPLSARALKAAAAAADHLPSLAAPGGIVSRESFGNGLSLMAHRSHPASGVARFTIERSNSSKRQVIAYQSSSASSTVEPGRHYTAVAGLLVLEPGQGSQEVTVPINADAMAALKGGSLSLAVEELPDLGQRERHLLFSPAAAGAAPVLSGFDFSVDPSSRSAQLSFRADVNNGSGSPNTLRFQVGQRSSADDAAPLVDSLSTLAVLDAVVSGSSVPPAYDSDPAAYALDTDQRHNAQVSSQLTLDLMAEGTGPALFLSGPALHWSSPASITSSSSLSFDQTVNLSAWRADQGSGAVSFALVSGDRSISLLQNASGGKAGAITPDSALDPGSSGWRSTEGKAVGSQAALSNLNLTGSTWIPTASRDGQPLALQDLQVDSNWIHARFEGGVSLQLFLDAITSAPTPTPVRPQVDIQRLAGQNNAIGFYALDAITGAVDGLKPGDSGYLQAALRRSEAADLLLDANELPAFGQERTYRELALDPNQQYGVLLVVDGSREQLFSSFAAANPGGVPQMLTLGTGSNGMVLGIEDLSVIGGRSDADYNDLIVRLGSINVALF